MGRYTDYCILCKYRMYVHCVLIILYKVRVRVTVTMLEM